MPSVSMAARHVFGVRSKVVPRVLSSLGIEGTFALMEEEFP